MKPLKNPFMVSPGSVVHRVVRARRPAGRPLPEPIDDLSANLPAGQRIICPWPDANLNPNSRVPWNVRSRAARAYRYECFLMTRSAHARINHKPDDPDAPIFIQIDFFPPDQRRRDDDNIAAAFKSGRDGIADALKVDDSRFVTRNVVHRHARACVVFTIMSEGWPA